MGPWPGPWPHPYTWPYGPEFKFGPGGIVVPPVPVPPDAVPINVANVQPLTTRQYVMHKGEREEWKPPNLPMFKFGAPSDLVTQMINIKDRVLFKTFTNLVEMIVMEGADEYDLAMALWMLSHCEGHLMINIPTEKEPKKLLHVANVSEKSRISELVRSVVGHLYSYPAHLVLETKFSTKGSIFDSPEITNRTAIAKIYEKVKMDYLEQKL